MPRPEERPDQNNQQRAEDLCSLAQERLEQVEPSFGQSVQALRQVLDILGDDPTPQADKIRAQVGELWRLLAETVPGMETAHALLLEGVQLLSGLSVTQTLEEMLKLVKLGLDVRRDLELSPNRGWPIWLEQSDAQVRLFYWQVSWCLMSGVISDPSTVITAQDALRKTQRGLHILALRAAETFEGMQEIDHLSYLQNILEALRKLNQGLVHFPETTDGDQRLIQLPPLPGDAIIPKTLPPANSTIALRFISTAAASRCSQMATCTTPG